MTPRSGAVAPSAGALRMRRSRARRRQGHVKVSLEVAAGATTDLAALGWLTCADRVDKDALAGALAGLVERAIAIGVTPSAGTERTCSTPVHVATGPLITIGSDEVLGAAEIVEDKPPEAQPFGGVDPAPPPSTSPFADTAAEPSQPFEVATAELWGPRLDLYERWRIWAPGWGPRPGQDGCLVPRQA
jgi:hypothetical protein